MSSATRPIALLLAALVGILLLPGGAVAAGPASPVRARGAAFRAPPRFTPPPEWTTICDSVGKRGTPLVRGTNCRYLKLDGAFRRWVVDVPRDPGLPMDRAWPVVMVIHGSSASGERMREKTNWPGVLEREGAIGIYPTAWRYVRRSNGVKVTRWASYTLPDEVDLGRRLDGYPRSAPYPTRDTVFLVRILGDLRSQLTLDTRHIHAAGSSQGGRFIARMAVEFADTYASMSCMGWCTAPPRGITPPRPMSILYAVGERDDLLLRSINETRSPDLGSIPLAWPAAWRVLRPYLVRNLRVAHLGRTPAKVASGSTGLSVLWRSRRAGQSWTTRFRLLVLRGVGHEPPAPWGNPLGIDYAEITWAFFQDNPRP